MVMNYLAIYNTVFALKMTNNLLENNDSFLLFCINMKGMLII